MENNTKTYKKPVRGQVDSGVRVWFSLKAWKVPGSIPVYHRSNTSQSRTTEFLEWVKNLNPHETYTRMIQTAGNYPLGHGQIHGNKSK